MRKLMTVAFTLGAALVAFGNINDEAAFIHYGLDYKANGDVNAWPDVRHYSTWNAASPSGTHRTSATGGAQGKVVAATCDVTTPTLGRTLKNEPCIRMNHQIVTNGTSRTYNCTSVAIRGCQADEDTYSFLLRFRPRMGADWVAGGNGGTERLVCFSPKWSTDAATARGIYVMIANRAADGSVGYIRIENGVGAVATTFGNLEVANGYWHELAVVISKNTVKIGLCSERFTEQSNRWRWETKTFANDIQFAIMGSESGSVGRGTAGECPATSPRGDFHYFATWYKALTEAEVYEAFSAGRSSSLAFGLETAAARAEAFCGSGSADVTLDMRPWDWNKMPTSLQKDKKLNLRFDVNSYPDRLFQKLCVRPADDAAAATVEAFLDGTSLGSSSIGGGTDANFAFPSERLLVGSHTLTVVRTDSAATPLALKGVTLDEGTRKGNVFDDAIFLRYGNQVTNASGRLVGWPDYRHAATWNPANPTGVHATTESNQPNCPPGTTYPVTLDVYSGTAGRTLPNEPCFRLNGIIKTNDQNAITYSSQELNINGLTAEQKIWTLLTRFRPDWDGWMANTAPDWERFFCLSTTWNPDPTQSRGVFVAIKSLVREKSGYIGFENGNVSTYSSDLVISNRVWHELAVIVSNNVIKVGLCNSARNTTGDSKALAGQWLWRTLTCGPQVQFGFKNTVGSIGHGNTDLAKSTSFRGDVHLVSMWNRMLDESEVCEAFAGGRTPLLDVGYDRDGVVPDVFAGDNTKDITLANARPWSWHNLPAKLLSGKKVSIPFTKESWHADLPQVLRMYPDSASAAGTQVKVSIDGTVIGTPTLVPGKVDCSIFVPANRLAQGAHVLTVERVDSVAGDLVLAGLSLEGSWRVETTAGHVQIGAYSTSNSTGMPYWYDVLCSWPSASGFTRNDWNSGVGPSRFRFEIPEDLLEAGYRYRLQYRLGTAHNSGVAGYPVWFILNGVTNGLAHTESEATMLTPQTIDLDAKLLKPGLNVIEFFDNRQVPAEDPDHHNVRNSWTTLEYLRFSLRRPLTGLGLMILLR